MHLGWFSSIIATIFCQEIVTIRSLNGRTECNYLDLNIWTESNCSDMNIRTVYCTHTFMLSYNVCISISDMDQPSSSRVRPTTSNRRRHHWVEEVVEEPDLTEEDVEEQPEMEMQPGPGPQDRSLLTNFDTHIAGYIWNGQVCFVCFISRLINWFCYEFLR